MTTWWRRIAMAAKKLCALVKDGYQKDNAKAYKELLRGARHMCKRCGRAAAKPKSLCKPAKL